MISGSNATDAVCEQAEREECHDRTTEDGVTWFGTYCAGDDQGIAAGAESELAACMDSLE